MHWVAVVAVLHLLIFPHPKRVGPWIIDLCEDAQILIADRRILIGAAWILVSVFSSHWCGSRA